MEYLSLGGTDSKWDMLVTDLDIDNDGQREVVIKNMFYQTWDSYEFLRVFLPGEIDLRKEVTSKDLAGGKDVKHPPSIVPGLFKGSAIIRPFIFKGATYLHIYNYKRPDALGEVVNAYTPPEKVWIRKYKGGGKVELQPTPIEFDEVCEFDMIVTNKYIPKIN